MPGVSCVGDRQGDISIRQCVADRVGQGKRDAALVVCFPANFCVCIEFDVQRRIQHGACALWQAVTVCERKPDDSGRKCGFGQAADVTGVQGQGG